MHLSYFLSRYILQFLARKYFSVYQTCTKITIQSANGMFKILQEQAKAQSKKLSPRRSLIPREGYSTIPWPLRNHTRRIDHQARLPVEMWSQTFIYKKANP